MKLCENRLVVGGALVHADPSLDGEVVGARVEDPVGVHVVAGAIERKPLTHVPFGQGGVAVQCGSGAGDDVLGKYTIGDVALP